MLISDYVEQCYLAERPGLSRGYRMLVMATARKLCAREGRQLHLDEIDRSMLAGWASSLLDTGRPSTANSKVRMVRTLLLAAYDDGLIDRPPRRIRRIPEDLPPPEAWTVAECRRLLAHLVALPGRVGERPASDWWTSLVLSTYWTGCRIGALLRVEVADYDPEQGLTVRQQKNGRQQWYALPPTCREAIDRIVPANGGIWKWPGCRRTLWVRFRGMVETAGLPCPTTGRQLFHRLRRTNASYCALVDPAIAQRQLDHGDFSVTRRSYIDPRIACQRTAADVLPDPMPPTEPPHLRVIG